MSKNTHDRRKILLSMAMVMMFLFADLMQPQAMPEWSEELDEEVSISWTTTTSNVTKDTGISSVNPSSSYGSDATFELGPSMMGEGKILIEFSNTFNTTEIIRDAILELTCGVDSSNLGTINIFSARLKKDWNSSNANWNGPDSGDSWDMPGADGNADRGSWEPPFFGYDNHTFSINVTAILQDTVKNNRSSLNLVIAALGTAYECHLSESSDANSRPQLVVTHSTGSRGTGGSLVPDFVEDGTALMDETSFLLKAATNPELSWNSLNGDNVQVQLSLSDNFMTGADDTWYYNTIDNSSLFTLSSSSGSMIVPSGDELSNSTSMYYRMRATDSTAQLGSWVEGEFHLPGHDVTDNGDNTASFEITVGNLGLYSDTIEDTFVDSSNAAKNSNMGGDDTFTVGSSSSNDQYGLMRINLDDVGMHSNSTIVNATLSLTRESNSGSANLSIHLMESGLWTEDGSTWRKSDGIYYWDDGGRVPSMSLATATGDQSSSTFNLDITAGLQKWFNSGSTNVAATSLDLMLVASTFGRDVTSTNSVNFESTETGDNGEPVLSVTYAYGGSAPSDPSHQSPLDGHPVWNLSGHNLSGNTTPDIIWSRNSATSNTDFLFEIATDPEYRNVVESYDTSIDGTGWMNSAGTTWTPSITDSSSDVLETGNLYHWRIAHRDSDGYHTWWQTSSFLVSALESTHLGNDEYELRLRHGNATTAGDSPVCADTYIDSGSSSTNYNGEDDMQVSYNTWPSETSILFGCDLVSHLLPSGYAVKSASFSMRLSDYPNGAPIVGAWESRQHNWTEDGATWATYDGTSSWGTAGAKGWERAGLLDSESLDSGYSAGDWMELDVTLGVQNSMRTNSSLDLVVGIVSAGSGSSRDALFYPNHVTSTSRPQLSFIYVPGSNAIPSDPVPVSPLNGSWSVESGIEPAPDQEPTLKWNFTAGNVTVGGWSLELDTTDAFDSSDLITATSWTDSGFNVTNMTFDVSTPLETGNTWHWRVRATSDTNQIGNWSNSFHFLLPELTTWSIDSETAAVELHHQEAMPDLGLPTFIDTWVADSGTGSTQNQASSSTFKVGTSSNGENATGLLKIPLNDLPIPQNAHVSEAELHLYAEFGSSTTNSVSVHSSLVDWNTSANGTTYDGQNNWSVPGGFGSNDSGAMSDVMFSENADWMTFDVTELVQAAYSSGDSHIALHLIGSFSKGQTIFTSTEGTTSQRPWINMTWSNGTAALPQNSGNNSAPANDEIIWDTSTHALIPGENPTFEWNHATPGSVDDWRLFIWEDHSNSRAGWTVYDSRESSSGWTDDSTGNYSWTSSTNLTDGESYKWFVQPITDDIYGARSAETIFHLPELTGGTTNSTDAYISLQEGMIVEALDYPAIFVDTYVDSGSSYSSYSSEELLIMGRSNATTSYLHESFTLLQINWSSMPIPDDHEFVEASLTLTKISGGELNQENVTIAMYDCGGWNASATYNSPVGGNTSWANSNSCGEDVPLDLVEIDYEDTGVLFDVTYAVQHAHAAGHDAISLGFTVVEDTSDEWHFASSDYDDDNDIRPELTLDWRTGIQWLPSSPTGLYPQDGDTLWNYSSSRPQGVDHLTSNFTSSVNNETKWIIQTSVNDESFIDSPTTFDSLDNSTYPANSTWYDGNNSLFMPEVDWDGDHWVYWRVRAEQGHRLGEWSPVHKYRIPGVYGSDDGDGNNSLTLYQGSMFIETDDLPNMIDSTIDSTSPNNNFGDSDYLDLGIAASGSGESKIMLEIDLSELPFPAAMTPTSALLRMYRSNITGTSSLTVSAHACDTFYENGITWNNASTCSSSEITRSTMLIVPPTGWQEWDLTSLAQSNIANGNTTMTIMLKSVGTPGSSSSFYSGDYWNTTFRPRLFLDYVDNTDGVIPPAQPTLIYPGDGDVLYNTTEWVLDSMDKPQLTWNAVPNATDYVVTIADFNGQMKYKSWLDNEINGTTFTFTNNLTEGEVYQWWVQAVNGSIPGPSSSRRSFAIGAPVANVDNGDNTWTYNFQTGNEVADLGHTNVRDSYIGSGFPSENHGSESMLIGTDCEGANTECRIVMGLDTSQIPLPLFANVHSASLKLVVSDQDFNGATSMTFSVHRLLTNAWSQSGSSWNNSAIGTPWSAGGMTAGVEYDANAVSSTTVYSGDSLVWLDIGHANMMISGDNAWVIIATPNSGAAWMEFYPSEGPLENRPSIMLNYTDVDSVSMAPKNMTTDADSTIQYSHILTDIGGAMIAGDVTWSASDGTINSTSGLFTPEHVGTHTITACWGVICTSEMVTVTPGAPVILIVPQTTASITADESYTIIAEVQDQFGNTVSGQTITYSPSNGSMNGETFLPYNTGMQNITVGWNSQTITVQVSVTGGIPTYYETTGCTEVIHAGTTCTLGWTLHDKFGNTLDIALGGGITWSVTGGTFTEENGTFWAITVGEHVLSMQSTGGITHQINLSITHGEMVSLEINSSLEYATADEIVYLNTTRIDVMGNRLSVELPYENWTSIDEGDGMIIAGQPAEWHVQLRGEKTITAQYAGMENSVTVQVSNGAITGLILVVDSVDSTWSLQNLTADDEISVKAKAHDNDGNKWTENVDWRIEHIMHADESSLQVPYGSSTYFSPTYSSATPYTLWATYTDQNTTIEVSLDISVGHGVLVKVDFINYNINQTDQRITADEELSFVPQLTDADGNFIDASIISYRLTNTLTGETTNITEQLEDQVWEATEVGEWSITAWAPDESGNYEISDTINVVVDHGVAVSLSIDVEGGAIDVDASTATAGDSYSLKINGTDSDGNIFAQSVMWKQNGAPVPIATISSSGSEGVYSWSATTAGSHTFDFNAPEGASSTWTIMVSPNSNVGSVVLHMLQDSVLQVEVFEIWVQTYDEWGNEIPVPPSTEVLVTGRMEVTQLNSSNWEITTLDEGEQTVTVTVYGVEVSDTIQVEGTFMGFFKSGGPLYYAGAALGILVILVLLVVVVMVMRSGSDEWDDEYDDDDDEEETREYVALPSDGPSSGPTGPGPGPGPGGPPPSAQPQEDTSWMVDHRVDDDGTEWAEDDTGIWWYRDPGASEWAEWVE